MFTCRRKEPPPSGQPFNRSWDIAGFTYRVQKNGDVEIFHKGRLASTLRGNDAEDFKQEAQGGTSDEAQQLMARVTGNYKHGNERAAGQHPRNRR